MKRFLTLLFFFSILAQGFSQNVALDRRPVWLGLNMGGTFQTSDMKPVAGIGWGATISRYSRLSKPGALYFGWRFRFLDGRDYGYNYHPLTGLNSDPVLSSSPNYAD
ncbi:MAG TPA: hypothetical protein VFU15_15005, partial [Bacteroidia bacterium]|nr:hypothetical protein [Bacteroidia bacterium]